MKGVTRRLKRIRAISREHEDERDRWCGLGGHRWGEPKRCYEEEVRGCGGKEEGDFLFFGFAVDSRGRLHGAGGPVATGKYERQGLQKCSSPYCRSPHRDGEREACRRNSLWRNA